MNDIPRLRMFAGPNGSGKSTIKSVIRSELLGVYINPDEIEADIRTEGFLDFAAFRMVTNSKEVLRFFQNSTLLARAELLDEVEYLSFNDDQLSFSNVSVNSYFASVAADFIRQKLLAIGISFTFETVMSSPDKVAFLQQARLRGYRNYLYYIATEDPVINILRIQGRVGMGGHSVPEDKIISRYARSLNLLIDAIRYTDRAYIFDNSNHWSLD